MTARRLAALVAGLPPDSAYHRDGRMWTQDNEIAAIANELTQMWLARILGAWMSKGSKLPDVIQIPHPDRRIAEPERKQAMSAREAAARLGMG